MVATLACATTGATAKAAPPTTGLTPLFGGEREWVKHRVVGKETLDWIAARYGVSRSDIIRWNRKKLGKKAWIYAGQKLRIHAPTPVPPPREKISYKVKRGDTWSGIAKRHNLPQAQLRAWNKKVPRAFRAGTWLVVWTNPEAPSVPEEEAALEGAAAPLPTFSIKPGGLSVGKPSRGSLSHGVPLPKSDMYTVRNADKAYGATHAIEQMMLAMASFRATSGYDQKLVIGAMSLKKGGRFRPHKSHQSGRDVDIRMPRNVGVKRVKSTSDIDWRATWHFVKALAATGEVDYIFMSWSRQRLLYRAAKAQGATSAELKTLIQYPRKPKTNNGLVRHSKGHDTHIHVRFKCAAGNGRCSTKR